MKKNLKSGLILGKYKLDERLSKGTFAETWRATCSLQNAVALQHLHNEQYIKLVTESSYEIPIISNPQIASFIEWDAEHNIFIWEYISGRKLSTFIEQLKKIKLNIAVYIARKILETLRFTTSQGLTHGGLRPGRIAITANKKIKLTHFGIGKYEQQLLYDFQLKNNSTGKNIQAYFAPEVLEDKIFEDPKSDIYSVGIILAEMLTGEKCPRQQILRKLQENKIPKSLISIILKSIADFGLRYNHPNEMHTDLTKLLKISESKDKIYIPPIAEKSALEAVPADSEEYRVYQEDHYIAKQSIDAKEVAAEPADEEEEDIQEEDIQEEKKVVKKITEEEAKEKIKDILQKTGRIDVDSVMFGTFGDTMLTPLEKVPIWPHIFIKYSIASIIVFSLGILYILHASPEIKHSIDQIPFGIFYAIAQWPTNVQYGITWFLLINIFALFTIPFWDGRGKLTLSNFFIPFYTTTIAGLIGLSFWRGNASHSFYGIIITSIFLSIGIVVGMITSHVSRFLRKQW